jgi:hypothetical protein
LRLAELLFELNEAIAIRLDVRACSATFYTRGKIRNLLLQATNLHLQFGYVACPRFPFYLGGVLSLLRGNPLY